MTKLVDLLVEWARRSQRWPLLILVTIPPAFELVRQFTGKNFAQTCRDPVFIGFACLAILVSGGLLCYYAWADRMRFSQYADRRRGGGRVLVSDAVAWQKIQYQAGEEKRTTTIARELAELLSESPYHVLVLPERMLANYQPIERDGFVLHGMSEGAGTVLRVDMVLNQARVASVMEGIGKPLDIALAEAEDAPVDPIGAKRFLRNQFLFSGYSLGTSLAVEVAGEKKVTIARLMVRYALASLLHFDKDPRAGALFREIVDIGQLLSSLPNPELAQVYKTTAFYFITEGGDATRAYQALQLARGLNANDPEILVMQAYLALWSGKGAQAAAIAESIGDYPDDPALPATIRGACYLNDQRHVKAIDSFKLALEKEKADENRFRLNLAIALCNGMADSRVIPNRADELITHTENAIQIDPDKAVVHMLQGFAWSLKRDVGNFKSAFERAAALASPDEQGMLTYWRVKSCLEFPEGQDDATVIAEMEKAVGDPASSHDADHLAHLAEMLLRVDRLEGASRCIDRAMVLDPGNAKIRRVKGLVAAHHLAAMEADSEAYGATMLEARKHLLESIRLGDPKASTHYLVGMLYVQGGDSVNGEKHFREAVRLDPEDQDYLLALFKAQARNKRPADARETLQRMPGAHPASAETWQEIGLAWQMAGESEDALTAYREAIRLDASSHAAFDNAAYVLFDLDRVDEALEHWDQAVQIAPADPDVLAGRALALEALGNHAEALDAYRAAVEVEPGFLDLDTLRTEFMYSERACKAARTLIKEIDPART